jgi:hypothetical protein
VRIVLRNCSGFPNELRELNILCRRVGVVIALFSLLSSPALVRALTSFLYGQRVLLFGLLHARVNYIGFFYPVYKRKREMQIFEGLDKRLTIKRVMRTPTNKNHTRHNFLLEIRYLVLFRSIYTNSA